MAHPGSQLFPQTDVEKEKPWSFISLVLSRETVFHALLCGEGKLALGRAALRQLNLALQKNSKFFQLGAFGGGNHP